MLPRHLTAITSQKWQGVKWNLITWLACWCKYLFVGKPKTNKLHRKQSLKIWLLFDILFVSRSNIIRYQRLDLIGTQILNCNVLPITYFLTHEMFIAIIMLPLLSLSGVIVTNDQWPIIRRQCNVARQCLRTDNCRCWIPQGDGINQESTTEWGTWHPGNWAWPSLGQTWEKRHWSNVKCL